jgi:glutathione gamma-glutamylcysteinyltransferase
MSYTYVLLAHPSFCGLSSLTMVLNSLLIDPQRIWQGVWRWFDESMLDCCSPLDKVRTEGITLSKVGCLAKCNGATVVKKHGSDISIDEFRADVKLACSVPSDMPRNVLLASYSRKVLKQSGDGHFSPIGGYHAEKDMVLIMDVARFKYPPHWVPLESLFHAMQPIDSAAGKSRGYLMISVTDESKFMQNCLCAKEEDDLVEVEVQVQVSTTDISEHKKIESFIEHECEYCSKKD